MSSSIILAFDTSSSACSVALQKGDQIHALHEEAPMQQAKLILPMIQSLLSECSLSFDNLDAIAYGCGPGSFTGIRIATSVAQGIAFAANKKVIPVTSLAVLAQSAYLKHQCRKILVSVDARMDQVYFASYEITQQNTVKLAGEEHLYYPKDVQLPDEKNWCGVGDGWNKFNRTPEIIYPTESPRAEALLQLAAIKFQESQWIAPSDALPVYLR